MTSVRVAAVGVLLQVERGHTTLAAEIERARLGIADRRDRGLLVELTAGATRWRRELDAVIAAASQRDVRQIDPGALAVLRVGAYQLRHLDRVPEHAIVHESVEAVRAIGAPRAAGFVNAVLRTMIRRGRSLKLPERPTDETSEARSVRYLAVTLSHPDWLVTRWLRRVGLDAAEQWCRFNNAAPDVTIRPLPPVTADDLVGRLREAGLDASLARFAPGAVQLTPGALGRVPTDLAAAFLVQDEGSQLVAAWADIAPGERVLDVCASPGGKTVIAADDLGIRDRADGSLLVAGDRRDGRVALLEATLRRAGLTVPLVALDALRPLPFGATFDCVLLDAPCSGLGTLRRDPDLKWSRQESDLPRMAADQLTMLGRAAEVVRPGGRLVYSTCSSEPDENVLVTDAFLARDSRFVPAPRDPSSGPWRGLLDDRGNLCTTPYTHGLDGYYAATLVRRPGT